MLKKQHNALRHIIEMLSKVIKDLLLHKCPLLSGIAWKFETKDYVRYT